jgi:CO/xanthine dehydrogenase Mo-binding subunit
MTGFMHEKEFSRKTFVKGGGVLAISLATGSALAGKASAVTVPSTGFNHYADPGQTADPNEYSSYGPSDPTQIDSWFVVHPDNSISLKLGRVDLGQGSPTALAMIAAEEMNHDINLMRLITNDTDITPNQGSTSGSSTVQTAGKSVRAAAAAAYQALLNMASANLGVPVASLSVTKGVVSGGGKTVTYAQLVGGKAFNVQASSAYGLTATTATPPAAGAGLAPGFPGLTKPVSQYTIIGVAPGPPRFDIPAKVTGTYTYVHNIRVPGMVHGRIIRPRGQGAYGGGTNPAVVSINANSIKDIPGAQVLQKGNFVGVIAPQEYDAIQAAAQLQVTWAALPLLPGTANVWGTMRTQDAAGQAPAAIKALRGNVPAGLASAAYTVSQTYKYAYNGHLPIGPDCCVADVTSNGARIFSNTQNPYATRTSVATILGFTMNQVRVSYYEGSSVYGSAPYDDIAQSAAVMSQLAGKPVRLQFMRWDEHGYDNYGPIMMFDIQLGADANGKLLASSVTEFAPPYYSTTPAMALTGTTSQVFGAAMSADITNTGTQYDLPATEVIGKSLPLQNNYFKISFLRAPQAPQTCFAYEQAIDELAYAAKMDPYTFRMNNVATLASDEAMGLSALTWDRWVKVLTLVGQMADWKPKVANSVTQTGNIRTGRGVAMGSYASTMVAEVADVTVNMKTGKITCTAVHCAQDTGLTQYVGGVENQAVGSIVMGASRALWEEVTFNSSNVTSLDWVSYPILRFKDAPTIDFQIVQRTDIPAVNTPTVLSNGTSVPASTVAASGVYSSGSGEPPQSCIGAAIANAFFDATGVRIRQAPMTPARVRATLKAAGVV